MLVVALLLAAASGCSTPLTIGSWQRNVEQYVALHGNDPNALRDVTLPGGRPGFAVIGESDPRHSTDVSALLLAHKPIDNQPWFIYLVGLVKKQKVSDIRLIALSYASGKPVWRVGPGNPQSLNRYRDYNRKLWYDRHSDGGGRVAAGYLGFPRDEDVFKVSAADHQAQATHAASGAQWQVNLAESK